MTRLFLLVSDDRVYGVFICFTDAHVSMKLLETESKRPETCKIHTITPNKFFGEHEWANMCSNEMLTTVFKKNNVSPDNNNGYSVLR